MIVGLEDKVIGVVCGGYSQERSVSLRSGDNVERALTSLGYKTKRIDPAQNLDDLQTIDLAFLALHGIGGEDGAIQGLLDRLEIPYTGSSAATSALALNKAYTKQCLQQSGFPVAPYRVESTPLQVLPSGFSYPVILKPISDGSSVGIYVIDSEDELEIRSKELADTYHSYLLEAFVEGREITVGLIQGKELQVLPILELRSKNRIYDYEAKYTPGLTEFICPAEISETLTDMCQKAAVEIFKLLKCNGAARVDMIVTESSYIILEVNTLPGMTATSDLPAQATVAGLSFESLVERLLESAC